MKLGPRAEVVNPSVNVLSPGRFRERGETDFHILNIEKLQTRPGSRLQSTYSVPLQRVPPPAQRERPTPWRMERPQRQRAAR